MLTHAFEIRPVLDTIAELYSKPITPERFKTYIKKLQGNTKGDLDLPISGFNPMAKPHVLEKIQELQQLNAETFLGTLVNSLQASSTSLDAEPIKVVITVADDLKGGWTNHYTTDFDSKFKINALVERNFCTPYFWTSEAYTKELIRNRTLEYMHRTCFWKANKRLRTLEEHLMQEVYVQQHMTQNTTPEKNTDIESIEAFYETHKHDDDYSVIFNFFYGDTASASLNYPQYGITKLNGFAYAKFLARSI